MTDNIGDPLVGDVIDGRYEILAKLARGGMSVVYRAHDRRLGRVVAIKVMREGLAPSRSDEADFARRFDNEARAAAALTDPNIVGVFDQGEDRGRPYIVMEFIEGLTLRNIISKEAPLPPTKAFALAESMAAALAAAHDVHLIHRDVKPENVLISTTGKVKMADFGLSRILDENMATTQDVLMGTVSYLPPERVTRGIADERSDVYSFGVVLYEMLTGRKPYVGDASIQVAYMHVNQDIPAPSTVVHDGLPDYIDALVLACTRRDPALRPKDGRELLARVKLVRRALIERTVSDPDLAELLGSPASVAGNSAITNPTSAWKPITPPKPRTPSSPIDFNETTDGLTEIGESVQELMNSSARSVRSPLAIRTPLFPEISNDAVHKRRRRIVGILLAILLLVVTAVPTWWYLEGRYTTVPELVGISETDALRVTKENHLTIKFDREYSEEVALGQVISTDPEPGVRVLRRTQVSALVSKGPERYAVPDLIGKTPTEAEPLLADQNLVVGELSEDFDEDIEEGKIARTGYPAGELVKRDTPIDLVISKGPQPRTIPDFTGRPVDEVVAELEAMKLEVEVRDQNSMTVPEGHVVSHDPPVDSEVARGSKVIVFKSIGPRQVEVPSLTYRTVESANQLLNERGLKLVITNPSDARLGIVTKQDPGAGNILVEGSEVRVEVLWGF